MAKKRTTQKKAQRQEVNSAERCLGKGSIMQQKPTLSGLGSALNGKQSSPKRIERPPDHHPRVRDLCGRLGYPVAGNNPDLRLYNAVSNVLQERVTGDALKQKPPPNQLYNLADHFLYDIDGVGLWRKHRLTHGLQGKTYFLNWPEHRDRIWNLVRQLFEILWTLQRDSNNRVIHFSETTTTPNHVNRTSNGGSAFQLSTPPASSPPSQISSVQKDANRKGKTARTTDGSEERPLVSGHLSRPSKKKKSKKIKRPTLPQMRNFWRDLEEWLNSEDLRDLKAVPDHLAHMTVENALLAWYSDPRNRTKKCPPAIRASLPSTKKLRCVGKLRQFRSYILPWDKKMAVRYFECSNGTCLIVRASGTSCRVWLGDEKFSRDVFASSVRRDHAKSYSELREATPFIPIRQVYTDGESDEDEDEGQNEDNRAFDESSADDGEHTSSFSNESTETESLHSSPRGLKRARTSRVVASIEKDSLQSPIPKRRKIQPNDAMASKGTDTSSSRDPVRKRKVQDGGENEMDMAKARSEFAVVVNNINRELTSQATQSTSNGQAGSRHPSPSIECLGSQEASLSLRKVEGVTVNFFADDDGPSLPKPFVKCDNVTKLFVQAFKAWKVLCSRKASSIVQLQCTFDWLKEKRPQLIRACDKESFAIMIRRIDNAPCWDRPRGQCEINMKTIPQAPPHHFQYSSHKQGHDDTAAANVGAHTPAKKKPGGIESLIDVDDHICSCTDNSTTTTPAKGQSTVRSRHELLKEIKAESMDDSTLGVSQHRPRPHQAQERTIRPFSSFHTPTPHSASGHTSDVIREPPSDRPNVSRQHPYPSLSPSTSTNSRLRDRLSQSTVAATQESIPRSMTRPSGASPLSVRREPASSSVPPQREISQDANSTASKRPRLTGPNSVTLEQSKLDSLLKPHVPPVKENNPSEKQARSVNKSTAPPPRQPKNFPRSKPDLYPRRPSMWISSSRSSYDYNKEPCRGRPDEDTSVGSAHAGRVTKSKGKGPATQVPQGPSRHSNRIWTNCNLPQDKISQGPHSSSRSQKKVRSNTAPPGAYDTRTAFS